MPRNKNLHISGTFKKSKKIKKFKKCDKCKKRWTLIFRKEGVYECSKSYNKGKRINDKDVKIKDIDLEYFASEIDTMIKVYPQEVANPKYMNLVRKI